MKWSIFKGSQNLRLTFASLLNGPFSSCSELHYKSETSWVVFIVKINFHSYANKINFHMESFARKPRFHNEVTTTRKWTILQLWVSVFPRDTWVSFCWVFGLPKLLRHYHYSLVCHDQYVWKCKLHSANSVTFLDLPCKTLSTCSHC